MFTKSNMQIVKNEISILDWLGQTLTMSASSAIGQQGAG